MRSKSESEPTKLRHLLQNYLAAIEALQSYDICSLPDYAEFLFERAFDGERVTRGGKGHDIIAPNLGRIQVKERRLPADGRIEERLHLRNVTESSCDYLGAVIFNNDVTVKKALLVPHSVLWQLIASFRDPENKIPFGRVVALPTAQDVTETLRGIMK